MAITKSTYTGDGSTTQYTFSFPYLSEDDVVVKVASVVVSNYSFANSSTILFTSAPANGASIEIIRDTNIDQAEATFFSGSAIRAEDLNTNFTQTFYAVQETDNEVTAAVSNASTALTAANTALSTANTAATDATTAVTTANTALSTANTASTAASNATTTANQASTLASSANTTANTAATNASTALSTANTALTNANSAVTTANTASTNASAAVTTANTASTNASAAVTTANTASTNASTALSTANTAKTTADAAIILADQAVNLGSQSFGDLYSSTAGSAGSKTIDLGNLTTGCASDHFTGESGGSRAFNCALGCGTFALGTL